jgi:hypothetical protein
MKISLGCFAMGVVLLEVPTLLPLFGIHAPVLGF